MVQFRFLPKPTQPSLCTTLCEGYLNPDGDLDARFLRENLLSPHVNHVLALLASQDFEYKIWTQS